jgi:hypothetical protein
MTKINCTPTSLIAQIGILSCPGTWLLHKAFEDHRAVADTILHTPSCTQPPSHHITLDLLTTYLTTLQTKYDWARLTAEADWAERVLPH